VIDLARINVGLDLEGKRFAGPDDKFVGLERKFREVNPRSCRVPQQTGAEWRGEDGVARRLLAPENDPADDQRDARDKTGSQKDN
jgi:hypothetical protein